MIMDNDILETRHVELIPGKVEEVKTLSNKNKQLKWKIKKDIQFCSGLTPHEERLTRELYEGQMLQRLPTPAPWYYNTSHKIDK